MIVPEFWAEARLQERSGSRQVTVRRFGWSDQSLADAQRHADERAREAMQRIQAGEALPRRERKVPYNGAEGLPIREEIVARYGDEVVTRNSYGALCLNTPDALFVDIDYEDAQRVAGLPGGCAFALVMVVAVVLAAVSRLWWIALVGLVVAFFAGRVAESARRRKLAALPNEVTPQARARARLDAFVQANPEWGFRCYDTPAGLRLLAMHRSFSPQDPEVARCFEALGADKTYARMCLRQNCFRARVSPKPWRIGVFDHLRPRPGVWPVSPAQLPARRAWVTAYEQAARGHAACRFTGEVGARGHDGAVDEVRQLHDVLSGAESGLPVA